MRLPECDKDLLKVYVQPSFKTLQKQSVKRFLPSLVENSSVVEAC